MRGRKPITLPSGSPDDVIVDLPSSAVRIPECPDHLKGEARKCWDRAARVLVEKNLYDSDTWHVLSMFALQWGKWLEAEDKVRKLGPMQKGAYGNKAVSSWVAVANFAADRCFKLAAELGLSPVSRGKAKKIRSSVLKPAASKYLKQV